MGQPIKECRAIYVPLRIGARRRALSNLYITNPNPDLPPVLYSGIKILGYEEKTIVPLLQLLI